MASLSLTPPPSSEGRPSACASEAAACSSAPPSALPDLSLPRAVEDGAPAGEPRSLPEMRPRAPVSVRSFRPAGGATVSTPMRWHSVGPSRALARDRPRQARRRSRRPSAHTTPRRGPTNFRGARRSRRASLAGTRVDTRALPRSVRATSTHRKPSATFLIAALSPGPDSSSGSVRRGVRAARWGLARGSSTSPRSDRGSD